MLSKYWVKGTGLIKRQPPPLFLYYSRPSLLADDRANAWALAAQLGGEKQQDMGSVHAPMVKHPATKVAGCGSGSGSGFGARRRAALPRQRIPIQQSAPEQAPELMSRIIECPGSPCGNGARRSTMKITECAPCRPAGMTMSPVTT